MPNASRYSPPPCPASRLIPHPQREGDEEQPGQRATGRDDTVAAAALFVMIGAIPHTDWLPSEVARDRHGFIPTGRDLPGKNRAENGQPIPLPLETSLPGVFAVGDVHAGSVKR
jgi:thioredoxin reductase (NADPH)